MRVRVAGGPPISLARCLTRWSSAPRRSFITLGPVRRCVACRLCPDGTRIHHAVPGMLGWGEAQGAWRKSAVLLAQRRPRSDKGNKK